MKSILTRCARFWSEERNLTAFLVLLVVEIFVITPFKRSGLVVGLVNSVLFSLLFMSGLRTMTRWKALQAAGAIFVALAVSIRWARDSFGVPGLEILDDLLMLTCMIGFLAIVLRQVFREGFVTAHRIQGAVAGYLLLSIIFTSAYSLIETLYPRSFQMSYAQEMEQTVRNIRQSFYYFSVITLTSTGYGDITAVNPFARTLVMMEALIGQLYTAILVARLVSLHIEANREEKGR
jgi:hypothetical protein